MASDFGYGNVLRQVAEAEDQAAFVNVDVFNLLDKQVVTAVIPVSCMLSLKEVAKATKLKKVEMMKPADAERLTGYKVGGISPFAQKKQLPTLLDARALTQDTILVSGGRRGLSVEINPQDFIQLLGATVAPIGE